MNENIIKDASLQGFLSDEAYVYENFAFSLKEKGYQFKHLNELRSLRLLSWQGAISSLGGDYAEMATDNPLYNEHHDQSLQIKMLFIKRVDVIQLDQKIFSYYRKKVASQGKFDTSAEVDRFPLFGRSPNRFLFRSAQVRDDFNNGLNRLKESGEYDAIFDRY